MKFIAVIFLSAVLFGCQTTSGTSSIQSMQKRQLLEKILEYDYDLVYNSAITVILDQGYNIKNIDKNNGLIVAEKFAERRQWGLVAYDRDAFKASIVLNPLEGQRTKVRYGIVKITYSSLGYGEHVKGVQEIVDPSISYAFFTMLISETEKSKVGLNK